MPRFREKQSELDKIDRPKAEPPAGAGGSGWGRRLPPEFRGSRRRDEIRRCEANVANELDDKIGGDIQIAVAVDIDEYPGI